MLAECKKFVRLHAIAQGMDMAEFEAILAKITRADGEQEGNWCYELTKIGHEKFTAKKYAQALSYYNLARFPYIDSTAKRNAHNNCLNAFNQLCLHHKLPVEKISLSYLQEKITLYLYKAKKYRAPLLLVIGGIVSIKEQWYQFIALGKRLKIHVALLEMPGVGENTCRYTADADLYIQQVLDTLTDVVDTGHIHTIAMSFGGHLMLKNAATDPRLRSIITVGAPLSNFFTDADAWRNLPQLTKQALAHCINQDKDESALNLAKLRDYALSETLLANLTIPICYIFSDQDEIIHVEEKNILYKNCKNFILYSFDDKHGSPNHFSQIKLIILYHLLKNINSKPWLRFWLRLKMSRKKAAFIVSGT